MPYVAPSTITHTTVPSHVAGEVYPAADYQTLVTDVNQMGSGYNTIVNDILSLVEGGTSLPTSPTDGQSFYYVADATNGVVWHLRYRSASASAYKWEMVGGNDLSATVMTNEAALTVNTFADLTTVGPTVTTPLAGDYIISWSAIVSVIVTNNYTGVGVSVGGTDPTAYVEGTSLLALASITAATGQIFTKSELKTAISASSAIKMRYRNNQAIGRANYSNRYISIRPVRVG